MTLTMRFVFVCSGLLVARTALADPPPDDTNIPPRDPNTIAPTPPDTPVPVSVDPTAPTTDVPATPPPPQTAPAPDLSYRTDTLTVSDDRPGPYSYAWSDPALMTGIGVGFSIGGGLTGFTDRTMRQTMSSNVGGLWDARLSLGTHVPIGIDISYLGTAANINTIAGASNGTLIGTTVEAALRYNILPHAPATPYVFAGAGWQRYDVRNMHFAQSDTGMAKNDNVAEFPMGVGFSLRDRSGFNADVRGTFRATTDSTLLLDAGTNNYAALHSWEASAAIGYEY